MTPLEQFDREEMERLDKILSDITIVCGKHGGCSSHEKQMTPDEFKNFIKSHDARRDAMMREELLGRIRAHPYIKDMHVARYRKEIIHLLESGLMDISSLTK